MGALANILVSRGGYNRVDAENAERGPRAAELAKEFGVSGYGTANGATGVTNPVDQLIKNSVDMYQQQIKDYESKSKEFDTKNPFSFDEVLSQKRKEVADRLDPYYNQTLDDFLRGVNLRRNRSLEDEQQILSDLTADVQDYTGKSRELLDDALDRSGEGFADANLFFSGSKLRQEGRLKIKSDEDLGNYQDTAERKQRDISLAGSRNLENLDLEETLKRRDINREKYAQTESGALQETNLAQLRRDVERSQYIGAPYASQSLSSMPNLFKSYI